jgi:peptide deformylase
MLDIYTLGEDVLRKTAEKVTEFDSSLTMLIDAMFETMEESDGIGLAAPQVGILKRFFVVDTRKQNDKIACINPEIIEMSHEIGSYEEGCLSIPGMYFNIDRPLTVTLQAQDVKGKSFTIKATGLLARVMQHEYDHLQGTLFIDRMEEEDREKLVQAYNRKHKKRK